MFPVVLLEYEPLSQVSCEWSHTGAVVLQAAWLKLLWFEGLWAHLRDLWSWAGSKVWACVRESAALLKHGFHLSIWRAPSPGLPVFICAKCEWELENGEERMAAF